MDAAQVDDGFDFSHYQDEINWPAVKAAGIKFAYGKVIEGLDFPDERWPANRAGAMAAGITVGGYYWAHANLDPVACAAAFLARLDQAPGMLYPIVDFEHNGNPTESPTAAGGLSPTQLHNWLHQFRGEVQKHYRLDTYTGAWFWDEYVLPAPGVATCAECAASRLYLSRYAADMGAVPLPWKSAAVWQYTETGDVPGVPSAYEDRDRLVGTEKLSDLIYAGAAPDPNQEGDFMGFINNQAEFNAALATAMSAWANAAPDKGFRKSLDTYFGSRIPVADTPGSINERIAHRVAEVMTSAADNPANLNHINSKLAQILGELDKLAGKSAEAPSDTAAADE